eukprot:10609743-Ditylum_brightwellii.AAC.1
MHQLCLGLKAGIEGAIHSKNQMHDKHSKEKNWGILLVGAWNGFSERAKRFSAYQGGRHAWQSPCNDSVCPHPSACYHSVGTLLWFFVAIKTCCNTLCFVRPPLGYHPDSDKSILH